MSVLSHFCSCNDTAPMEIGRRLFPTCLIFEERRVLAIEHARARALVF